LLIGNRQVNDFLPYQKVADGTIASKTTVSLYTCQSEVATKLDEASIRL
jgi:hypothetical protein